MEKARYIVKQIEAHADAAEVEALRRKIGRIKSSGKYEPRLLLDLSEELALRESILRKKEFAINGLFWGSKKVEEVREKVSYLFDLYAPVAKVYTNDIDEVFALGNFERADDDNQFVKLVDRMRSVSVGDIVYDSLLNSYFMVDPSGWARVEEPESTRKHFNDVEAAE